MSNRRVRLILILVTGVLLDAVPLWLRGYRRPGRVIVRCRQGHLFTTLWIPGGSLKSLRLGPWRLQRCPVGHHFSLVAPVGESELTTQQLQLARAVHDAPIP